MFLFFRRLDCLTLYGGDMPFNVSLKSGWVMYVFAIALVASPFRAFAQDYPSKTITFVVPYPPGGASDQIARTIGQKLSLSLKQPVIIENRPGANGIIALQQVSKAAPDGHTLLMANIGPNAINPSIYERLPYDALKDFTPVTLTTLFPLVMVAGADQGLNNIGDLINKAKAQPGALSYAGAGVGTAGHMAMELFKTIANVDIKMVGYKGDTPALQDVLGGHVPVMLATVIAAKPYIQSGKLKPLVVTTTNRLDSMPNVPTLAESGMPGFEAVSWGGVMVPAGTPRSVVDKLHSEIVTILKMPDVKERLAAMGAEIVGNSPDEFKAYVVAETTKWAKVARAAKIKAE
jgi:tripartite-type tricarboxylate transporter receptor subunit TctC